MLPYFWSGELVFKVLKLKNPALHKEYLVSLWELNVLGHAVIGLKGSQKVLTHQFSTTKEFLLSDIICEGPKFLDLWGLNQIIISPKWLLDHAIVLYMTSRTL